MYENKYLGSLREIMKSFNEQIEKVNLMNQSIELVKVDIRRNGNVSDDQIRVWYQEDYANRNSLISFGKYKEDIMKSLNQKKEQLQNELESKNNDYRNALNDLKTIKENAKREILKKRNELELLLSEKTMASSEIASEIDEIKAALSELSNMLNRIDNIDENLLEEINEELTNSEYELLLDMYNDGLERLFDLQQQVEKGEIEYSEYEKFADYMAERYDYMSGLRASLTNPNSPYSSLSSEELTVQGNVLRNRLEKLRDNKEGEIAEYLQNELLRRPDNVGYDALRKQLEAEYLKKEKEIEEEIKEIERYQSLGELIKPGMILRPKKEDDIVVDPDVAEYNLLLEMYYEDWYRYGELQEKMQKNEIKNEIEYSEYEKFADYMSERYHYMMKLYNELKNKKQPYSNLSIEEIQRKLKELEEEFNAEYQYRAYGENGTNEHDDDFIAEYNRKKKALEDELKRKNNPFTNLTDDELQRKLKELEEEFNDEYYYRTHRENGLIEHDDNYLQDLEDKIKRIKEEIERRKGLNDIEKPLDPGFVGQKIVERPPTPEPKPEEPLARYYGFGSILEKVCGDIKCTKFDNFIYTHKNIKIWNWKKSTARTFWDKLGKLNKTVIGTVFVNLPTWLLSNASYKFIEAPRERINQILSNIDKLTEEEIDALVDAMASGNEVVEHMGTIPDVVWNALYQKIAQRIHYKVSIANTKIEVLYKRIIENYKKAIAIQKRLNEEQLTPQQIQELKNEYNELSKSLCNDIVEVDNFYKEIDGYANASGLRGISENYRARKNNVIGERNSTAKTHYDAGRAFNFMDSRVRQAINEQGDGVKAAKYFLMGLKFKSDSTIIERTFKNKGGKASNDAYNFSPYVKFLDYSEDTYLSDVLLTVIMISGILNTLNALYMNSVLAKANAQIAAQNAQIDALNKQIDALKMYAQQVTPNPDEFAKMYKEILEKSVAEMQHSVEYLAQTAQAGAGEAILKTAGDFYKKYDKMFHDLSGETIRDLNNTLNDPTLTSPEKIQIMTELGNGFYSKYGDFVVDAKPGIDAHLGVHGSAYDFTATHTILKTLGSTNPTYTAELYNNLFSLAQQVNNLGAINKLAQINVNVPILPQLVPIAAVLGYKMPEQDKNKDKKEKQKSESEIIADKEKELKKLLDELDIDVYEMVKERYKNKKAEWDSKGPIYKLFHMGEKPKRVEFQRELLEELKKYENGRSL